MEIPVGHTIDCGLFNDTTTIRMQLRGEWTAQTAEGLKREARTALIFGPQSRLMPVTVSGSFTSIGISLRPGAGFAVMKFNTADIIDRIRTCDEYGLPGSAALSGLEACASAEECLQLLEDMIRMILKETGAVEPDPVSVYFEAVSMANPTLPVAEIARQGGIELRRLERIVRRDFGMSPKKVLRRARALDMASQLRGVADEAEADELELRYYDQSYLIREFTELFGMAPSQFVATPQPILTLALESRQARRLEAIERVAPGARRPWQ